MKTIKEITIWYTAPIAGQIPSLASYLLKKYNISTSVICVSDSYIEHLKRNDNGTIAEVCSIANVYKKIGKGAILPEESEIVAKSEAFEKKYNIRLNDVIRADRHLGRGYVKGTPYPRSTLSEGLNLLSSLHLTNEMISFFEDFFARRKPFTLVSTGMGDLATKTSAVVARQMGIEMRILTSSRFSNLYHWAYDEYLQLPPLRSHFLDMKKKYEEKSGHLDKDSTQVGQNLGSKLVTKEYHKKKYLGVFLKHIFRDIARPLYHRLKGLKKVSRYYLWDTIRIRWNVYWGFKKLSKKNFPSSSCLEGKKFLFCPLHIEPESSLMVLSPEFTYQQSLIDMVSKVLPAGWLLVVKEHPAHIGRRSQQFNREVNEYPNVVLVNPYESASKLLSKCEAVVTITGSVGLEAAVRGIPVISFGRYNIYNFLDHVFYVDSYKTVANAVEQIEKRRIPEKAVRQENGYLFKKAIEELSFPIHDQGFLVGKSRKESANEEAAPLILPLLKSLLIPSDKGK